MIMSLCEAMRDIIVYHFCNIIEVDGKAVEKCVCQMSIFFQLSANELFIGELTKGCLN